MSEESILGGSEIDPSEDHQVEPPKPKAKPKAKAKPVLDRSKDFATIHGSPGPECFLQDGKYFGAKGDYLKDA